MILNQTHLRHVLREYVASYNTARPHQGIAQQTPVPRVIADSAGAVPCRNVLGGVIHDYCRLAAQTESSPV